MRLAVLAVVVTSLVGPACSASSGPETLETGRDTCALCRMPVSDARFAAQIVVDGALPVFFDEPGCLADFVRAGGPGAREGTAWVADHRTGAWVRADQAVYTRVPDLPTPMNHHLVAHENAASRDADPAARGGRPVAATEVFGTLGPPAGGVR